MSQSRLAGRNKKAQRFSGGKASECLGPRHNIVAKIEILCRPRGTRIPSSLYPPFNHPNPRNTGAVRGPQ